MADISLTLNDQEQQVLGTLLDAAVRHLGAQAAEVVSHFLKSIAAAQETSRTKDAGNVVDIKQDVAA